MAFEVLRADGADGHKWRDLLARLPLERRDIHFLPEYGRIYQRTYGHEPSLAVIRSSDASATILQPFVRRPLGDLPFLHEQRIEEPYCDIANAYGYGGPAGIGNDAALGALAGEFEQAFSQYLNAEGIASEFCSLHPLLIEHQLALLRECSIVPEYAKDVVVIDISVPEHALFAGMSRGVRAKVNKARRSGVSVGKVDPSPANLAKFNRLYVATMDRKQAAARWYFPECYFHDCVAELGPSRTSLFFAFVGEEIAAASFLMHEHTTAYYHFGAGDERFFDLRPNDILMAETALWAGKQGYLRYHLGGGVTARPDDDLLRFKGGFGVGRAPLFTYARVHNERNYDRLCALKRNHEISTVGAESSSGFRPMYRR